MIDIEPVNISTSECCNGVCKVRKPVNIQDIIDDEIIESRRSCDT